MKCLLKLPPEVDTINLWKLLVTVYGLCDAPRAWYLKVKEVLEKAGARKSKFDDAIFYWYHNDKLEGILSCKVDDFVWGGTNNFIKKVINVLKQTFSINSEECETIKYLGLYVQQKDGEITIHQVPYTNELKEFQIEKSRKEAHLTKTGAQELRTLADQLNWTSSQTCPDNSYQACKVSTSIKNATICDLKKASKYIRKLKSLEVVLKFPNLGNLENVRIMCFSDASFANLKSGSSRSGFIIFLCGSGEYAPIGWKSNKLERVVKSALSAETLALEEALESSFMIKSLLCELLSKEMKSDLFPVISHLLTQLIQLKHLKKNI